MMEKITASSTKSFILKISPTRADDSPRVLVKDNARQYRTRPQDPARYNSPALRQSIAPHSILLTAATPASPCALRAHGKHSPCAETRRSTARCGRGPGLLTPPTEEQTLAAPLAPPRRGLPPCTRHGGRASQPASSPRASTPGGECSAGPPPAAAGANKGAGAAGARGSPVLLAAGASSNRVCVWRHSVSR
jgi:hypothetical protein